MANESAKKRVAKNAAGLKWRRAVSVGALVVHLAAVYGLSRTHAQRPVLLFLSTLAGAAAYGFLHVACRPVYGPGGELTDGGSDIGSGLCETASDVLLLVAGVHLLASVSRTAWYLLFLVPASLLYTLSSSPLVKAVLGSLRAGGGQPAAGMGTAPGRAGERDARQKQLRQRGMAKEAASRR